MISRSRFSEISLLVGRVRLRSMRDETAAALRGLERAEFSRAADQAVAVEIAPVVCRRGARHERVAELREADGVFQVGQRVGRVPARLADEPLEHGAVVAGQVVGEADLGARVVVFATVRRRDVVRRDERAVPRVGPAGERRDAVGRQRLVRPLVPVVLEAHAEVQRQAVGRASTCR